MDSEVMKTLSGGQRYNFKNEKDLRSNRPSTYTATISGFKKVYNVLPGTVLFFGLYKGLGTLYIAVSEYEILRYMNLEHAEVVRGDKVDKGTYLGLVSTKPLEFEYCTEYQQGSKYPVRFNYWTYYKQNPIDILDGVYWPYREPEKLNGVVRPDSSTIQFTDEQRKEWFSKDEYFPIFPDDKPWYMRF